MKQNIIIDANNLYVQGLIKVINQFMLEEASGCSFTERRLEANIERLRKVFGDERKHMAMSSNTPIFGKPSLDKYKLIFKAN
ncbi:hypothetical protein [Parabacteroides pacaensis]|uniref:hypothetical protein n=1 Tax=Parabacteroides pacaensis TaxID=2086575 RepID=UPI000D0F7413|nr:hypothetical protein [Parabacteroides pacaensis]